jgi:GNAT superfamily N-acetyltransferase
MIRLLQMQDYNTWINLAKEVEYLFGPMVDSKDFQEGIKNCLENNNAFGIENEAGKLAGIIALDRENNEILWLAVAKQFSGNNYGELLVKKSVAELERNGDIFVQTFSGKVNEGRSARSIYERSGFVDLKDAGKNLADIETVIMVYRTDK